LAEALEQGILVPLIIESEVTVDQAVDLPTWLPEVQGSKDKEMQADLVLLLITEQAAVAGPGNLDLILQQETQPLMAETD
tara:strand:- start:164 stop:403 length:240 start_codon:yes stop_codon:yes gene_type:complete